MIRMRHAASRKIDKQMRVLASVLLYLVEVDVNVLSTAAAVTKSIQIDAQQARHSK